MSISDIKSKKSKAHKTIIAYLGITIFCGVFSTVYEHFSHGVYSDYMIFLFLFPLAGGVLPFTLIWLIDRMQFPGRISLNLYNSGIATLSVGSCFKGVLEIYGTTSFYMPVYWIAGTVLAAAGAAVYLFSLRK